MPTPAQVPVWDLADLYAARRRPRVEPTCAQPLAAADARGAFKGKLAGLDGAGARRAARALRKLEEQLGRVASFAQLLHAADRDDPETGRFYQGVQERVNDIGTRLLFVTLELNKIEEAALAAKLEQSPALARYRPWLDTCAPSGRTSSTTRSSASCTRSTITGRSAWVRLFDETMAGLRFPLDGKELTSAEIFDLLSDKDRALREAAAGSISGVLSGNARLFAQITNTLAKDKQIEDGWRHFARPISSPQPRQPGRGRGRRRADRRGPRRLPAPVAPLLPRRRRAGSVSTSSSSGIATRRCLRTATAADRLAGGQGRRARRLPAASRRPSPTSSTASSKAAGSTRSCGRARTAAPSATRPCPASHPYVLMNYQGRARDVMTLAHELGHGVHQVLAAEQGPLMAGHAADARRDRLGVRRAADLPGAARGRDRSGPAPDLLAAKIEDEINTVVRQIAFCEFERRVHDARQEGRADRRRAGQGLARGPDARAWARRSASRGLPVLLELHSALHPCAVLRLCLCVRRLSGELALRGLRGRARRLSSSATSRCCGPAAPGATASCSPPSASTPRTPASGPRASACSRA